MIIFKEKNNFKLLGLLHNFDGIKKIEHMENNPSKLFLKNNMCIEAECIHCSIPNCIIFKEKYSINELLNFPSDKTVNVCPVSAISVGEDGIPIISDKCISCGLCAIRCPIGAIFFKEGKFHVNSTNTNIKLCAPEKALINQQYDQIKAIINNTKHTGQIINSTIKALEMCYRSLNVIHSPNIFVRNILLCLNILTMAKRVGDVYTRMDLVFKYEKNLGEIEVEFGDDTLSATRRILDDIAILAERYNIKIEDNIPLIVTLYLPHKRQGFWQVVKDVKEVLGIQINTITVGVLLFLMWNFKSFNPENFYIDFNDMSLKKILEKKYSIKFPNEKNSIGIFEPKK